MVEASPNVFSTPQLAEEQNGAPANGAAASAAISQGLTSPLQSTQVLGSAPSGGDSDKKKQEHEKTYGEKRFDSIYYRGLGWIGNTVLSVVGAYLLLEMKNKQGLSLLDRAQPHIKGAFTKGPLKFLITAKEGSSQMDEQIKSFSKTIALMGGGFAVMPVMSWMEKNKLKIIKDFDKQHYKDRDVDKDPKLQAAYQAIESAPKQNALTTSLGRIIGLGVVIGTMSLPGFKLKPAFFERFNGIKLADLELKTITDAKTGEVIKKYLTSSAHAPNSFKGRMIESFVVDNSVSHISEIKQLKSPGFGQFLENAVLTPVGDFFSWTYRLAFPKSSPKTNQFVSAVANITAADTILSYYYSVILEGAMKIMSPFLGTKGKAPDPKQADPSAQTAANAPATPAQKNAAEQPVMLGDGSLEPSGKKQPGTPSNNINLSGMHHHVISQSEMAQAI